MEERGDASVLVLPTPEPLAYLVDERDEQLIVVIHGAVAAAGVVAGAGRIRRISMAPADPGSVRMTIALRGPAYGYDVRWHRGAMELRVRHPPRVDPVRPLAGLTIAVDAGHPPGGAMGPTGLAEPAVTLDVARRVAALLAARGARVVMTRADANPVSLDRRIAITRGSEAHALVSLHADAVASGADPSRDIGTAVYADRPHSALLATAVQAALVARLGLPDRRAQRGDYAVVRSTWLPAVLCEGATMTVPEQEAALALPAFRQAYALGVAEGLEAYFRDLRQRVTASGVAR